MKYRVEKAVDTELNVAIDKLTTRVEQALAEGWELQGGVSVFVREQDTLHAILCQALVKK